MDKKYDVVALGELLIDFTHNGISEQGNLMFEANPGGAPCNVLAMLNNLGHKTAFLGKVGNDFLGKHLNNVVLDTGIDTEGLVMDNEVHTTLAFVHTMQDGDRDFSFYREPGADMMLGEDDILEEKLENTKIFHFGSLSMTHEKVRKATKKAIRKAKENGAIISFDPNLRAPLWNNLEEAKEQIRYGMSQCDVLKISDNEIQWITGEEDYTKGVIKIREEFHIPLILVSMGKEGSRAYLRDTMIEAEAFIQEHTIETTGAGDTFCACILHYILQYGIDEIPLNIAKEMLRFANGAASLITTRRGALKVMPSKNEIKDLISRN